MLLLTTQTNFDIILSSHVEECLKKKNYSLSFVSLVCFQTSKIWMFFEKFTAELLLKSLSGRNKYLQAPVFGFTNSLSNDLEESRDLRALIGLVLG